jgi:hypothetical protein
MYHSKPIHNVMRNHYKTLDQDEVAKREKGTLQESIWAKSKLYAKNGVWPVPSPTKGKYK